MFQSLHLEHIRSSMCVMDRDNVLRTEQRAQGGADGSDSECLRIWTDIMAVLEVMQKTKQQQKTLIFAA